MLFYQFVDIDGISVTVNVQSCFPINSEQYLILQETAGELSLIKNYILIITENSRYSHLSNTVSEPFFIRNNNCTQFFFQKEEVEVSVSATILISIFISSFIKLIVIY